MKPEEAKPICECTLLGLEREGMTPAVHPDVVGVGIGYKRIRGFASQDLALKVYVRQKVHPLLVKDGRAIPDEVEGAVERHGATIKETMEASRKLSQLSAELKNVVERFDLG